ncbi:MAG: EAL domain-containing protein [Desulfobacteraceae bacterium]|nr:EAL domain-containing protein [Desulfobacteraceae bacterium]
MRVSNIKEKILIVDDTPANIEIMGEILKEDYEISVAVNGETALEIADSLNSPHLILLDIMMPEMDGYEVLKRLKKNPSTREIPVIFVTAKIEDEDEALGFSLGACDYIRKPFSSEVIKARIKSQIDLRNYRESLKLLLEKKESEVEKSNLIIKNNEIENKRLEKALHTEEISSLKNQIFFKELFTNSPFGILLTDKSGRIIRANKSLLKMTGFTESELLNLASPPFITDRDMETSYSELIKTAFINKSDSLQTKCIHKRGFDIPVSALAFSVGIEDRPECAFIIFEDISQRKKYENELKYQAFHDSLTNIPNRSLFSKKLEHAIEMSKQDKSFSFAVMLIDLDRFKTVNDSLGHHTGDKLLKSVTSKIKNCLRSEDLMARLGGDEFGVLIHNIKSEAEITAIAQRIKNATESTFYIEGNEISISASIGVVTDTDKYINSEQIIRDADIAMYEAKDCGKACFKFFCKELNRKTAKKLIIEKDLKTAVKRKSLFLNYQPVINIEKDFLKGFEALIRWHHKDLGMVSPADFIPVAEETGLINDVGDFVIEESVKALKKWHHDYKHTDLTININISVKQLMHKDFTDKLVEAAYRNSVSPEHIKIEITESLFMTNSASCINKLKTIKNSGFKIVIDDFGTGYSSLSYLHKFPVDEIKIDRSFISDIEKKQENLEIVKSILSLSKSIGFNVIAEGIETKEQLEILKDHGLKEAQGFYFSRPLTEKDAEKFISRWNKPSKKSSYLLYA